MALRGISFLLTWQVGLLLLGLSSAQASSPDAASGATFATYSRAATGETVLEIGNTSLRRTVVFGENGGVYTDSLVNNATGQNYLGQTATEFKLTLSTPDGQEAGELTSHQFRAIDFQINRSDSKTDARIMLEASFEEKLLTVYLNYEATSGQNFVRKWLTIEPFAGSQKIIRQVTLEDWQPAETLKPFAPVERYSEVFGSGEPNYQASVMQGTINLANPEQRYSRVAESKAVAIHDNNSEGFYFFTESLFGQELFNAEHGLQTGHTDWESVSDQPYTSGTSVIGVWQGAPEIGFKRYNEYIYNNYAAIRGKRTPVVFNTWFPYTSGIDESLLLTTLDEMKAAGYYDVLHIDAGWQKGAPLQVDIERFPNGLDPIVNKAKEYNLNLGFWINPFSSHYESLEGYDALRAAHPEWVDESDPAQPFCPLSGAGNYVREHLQAMVANMSVEEIYWDGADWNIFNCQSSQRNWSTLEEEHHRMLKFYAWMLNELHAIRPDLQVVLWNAPADIHWLSVVDQIQLSDVAEPPLLESELIRRQQMYYATAQTPYTAIWGDWYGLSYQRGWEDGLGQPLNLLKYALVSVIGNGAMQAGAVDLRIASPALQDFMRDIFSWRKQFNDYFRVYEPLLNFPDGANIDGEAHIVNGRGFIMLYNPTNAAKSVRLPLNEPGLELKSGVYYNLSDWTNLKQGQPAGKLRPEDNFTLSIPAYGYKIIGINI